ncbi:MAG: RNA methyltransferase, partial [Deltaproteobacteria bacterium]|nr:RNA methyltransferase [Deltaproteobacteria bacterium]
LLFGTGRGLAEPALARASVRLEPIRGQGEWNHLSVRAAIAIALDRLRGQ